MTKPINEKKGKFLFRLHKLVAGAAGMTKILRTIFSFLLVTTVWAMYLIMEAMFLTPKPLIANATTIFYALSFLIVLDGIVFPVVTSVTKQIAIRELRKNVDLEKQMQLMLGGKQNAQK